MFYDPCDPCDYIDDLDPLKHTDQLEDLMSYGKPTIPQLTPDQRHRWTVKHSGGPVRDWWNGSCLEVEVLKRGKGTYRPKIGDDVVVDYVTKTLEGRGIDWSRKPIRFTVQSQCGNPSGILQGLHMGVQQMTRGTRARLYIPSHLAYGWNTSDPLARNAELVMDVTVRRVCRIKNAVVR